MAIKTNNLKKIAFINGKIYDPLKNKLLDGTVTIENGILKNLNYKGSFESFEVIDCKNKIISPGFLDIRCNFRNPGQEDAETFETGANSALAGGYTKVCIMPNTNPVLDNPEIIESILKKTEDLGINIFPIGAISKDTKGKELSEIGLMSNKGIVAISDGLKTIKNSQMMRNALEYAKMFNIPVINFPQDLELKNNGIANESLFSTKMGIPASPGISESIIVYRDLEIANFVNGRIHIPLVSTKESVNLIRKYKDKGVKVTAEASPHHIGLNEEFLINFDSLYKVDPPLRSEDDIGALIEGLKDGTIDCIASDHYPHRIQEKEADLLNAESGIIGLESAFSYSNRILSNNGFNINDILKLFTLGPKNVLELDWNPLKIGEYADIVILDPNINWTFLESNIFSKSKNSPFIGKDMKGKVEMVVHKKTLFSIS